MGRWPRPGRDRPIFVNPLRRSAEDRTATVSFGGTGPRAGGRDRTNDNMVRYKCALFGESNSRDRSHRDLWYPTYGRYRWQNAAGALQTSAQRDLWYPTPGNRSGVFQLAVRTIRNT